MLSISTCTADMASNYYTQDDYYTRDATTAGIWQGAFADELGIVGKIVTPEQFELLLRESGMGCSAYDLTFSAPKSVSIIAETGEEKCRKAVIAAHKKAVTETLSEIEKNEVFTRTKQNGIIIEHKTAQMAAAKFTHHLSRELDPDLHTHCVMLNKTIYQGGDCAINGQRLYAAAKVYSFEYRSRLARELQKIGYSIEITDKDKGFFEIKGFQEDVLREFSKRRQQIEEYARENGVSENEATLKTRRAKEQNVNLEEQRNRWREVISDYGQEIPKPEAKNKRIFTPDEKVEEYKEAIESMQFQEFAWNQKRFEEAAVCYGIGVGLTREEARYLIETDQDIMRGDLTSTGETFFTTEHNIQQQKEIFSAVEGGRNQWRYSINQNAVTKSLVNIQTEKNISLSKQQSDLVHHIAESKDQIIAVRGLAGVGKTFALDVAREVLEQEGYEVRGMSASGQAAKELANDAHLGTCTTIQRALNEAEKSAGGKIKEDYTQKKKWRLDGLKQSTKPTVWFMDEASLTDNNTMFYAIEMIQRRGDKLVMIGDDKQLPPVGVGNSFSEMVQQGHISTVYISDIQRQRDSPKVLEAVNEIALGDSKKSLQALSDDITEIKKPKDRLKAMTEAYCNLSPDEQHKTMILTARNSEREALNLKIRKCLMDLGIIEKGQTYLVDDGSHKTSELEFSIGDKVIFLKNDMRLGIMNGTKGEIKEINGNIFSIAIDQNKSISIDLGKYRSLDYGYAITTHKAQGATVKRAMINLDSRNTKLNSRNAFYVDISRAKMDVQIFCDDKEKLSSQISKFATKISMQDLTFRHSISEDDADSRWKSGVVSIQVHPSKESKIDFSSNRSQNLDKIGELRTLIERPLVMVTDKAEMLSKASSFSVSKIERLGELVQQSLKDFGKSSFEEKNTEKSVSKK